MAIRRPATAPSARHWPCWIRWRPLGARCASANCWPTVRLSQGDALPVRADADQSGHAVLRPRPADLCARPAAGAAGPCGLGAIASLAPIARPHLDALSRPRSARPCTWRSWTTRRCFTSTSATPAHRSRCSPGRQGRARLLHRRRQGDAGLPARGAAGAGAARSRAFTGFTAAHADATEAPARRVDAISARAATPMTAKNMSRASSASPCRSCRPTGRVLGALVGHRHRPRERTLAGLDAYRAPHPAKPPLQIIAARRRTGAFPTRNTSNRQGASTCQA